jgi:hypothetical protein
MTTRGAAYLFSLSLIAVVLAVGLVGCGGGGGGGGNNDPVINSLTAAAQTVWQGGSTQVTVSASDPDGNPLSYAWTTNGGSVSGSGASVLFTAPASGGEFRVNVTVSDGQGGQASRNITITVGATVRGTVVDVADDQLEPGVEVRVNGLSDTTDNQGAFEIIGISQGTHALTLGGDWVVSGAGVNVTANTAGQVITLADPVRAVDIGGGPPPPPF